ncbi:uncharacterized protein LY79DRAFT_541094 [Colletotrichum navitas]|uniref:Uncharacterized protein n=1 Tax=Colletotrichum navitas TaxID=681940 RepID=A0AAD8Q8Y0_9PEZI|nr:uncharacterized protein LY79DRAFT_541094 [Colletotrichum navitas]KAK1597789.1 hypothetical protein LY79DRAFT_541094 [Colletotrichum navitas]
MRHHTLSCKPPPSPTCRLLGPPKASRASPGPGVFLSLSSPVVFVLAHSLWCRYLG